MRWLEDLKYKYLERKAKKAKPVYLCVQYAHWCVREYAWAGKFVWDELCGDEVPLVYQWSDHNGTRDTWDICKLTNTTTGRVYAWTFNKRLAEAMVKRLENNND